AVGVEDSPIGADTAFIHLPRLVGGFDDVVVDAQRLGAGDEVAQYLGLLDPARIGLLEIVAGARPAELGDDDALARVALAQLIVGADRVLDRGRRRAAFPVGQDVDGDEVHAGDELGVIAPHVPDFAGGHRDRAFALDPLDDLDEPGDRDVLLGLLQLLGVACLPDLARLFRIQRVVADGLELVPVDRLVADHDGIDVVVLLGEVDGRAHLALVALLGGGRAGPDAGAGAALLFLLVGLPLDPGADRHVQVELGGDPGHELVAAGGGIGAQRPRIGRDDLE